MLSAEDSYQLTPALKGSIEEVLQECADQALLDALQQYRGGRTPTKEECKEVVRIERIRRPDGSVRRVEITLAMELGNVMHELAGACAEKKLQTLLMPSQFDVQMTYRRNPETGATESLDKAIVKRIKREWRRQSTEKEHPLHGSITPDVVIHQGNPLKALAVYDFKFPCGDSGETGWRRYRDGPHAGRTQKDVYEEFLEPAPVMRVLPGKRILP